MELIEFRIMPGSTLAGQELHRFGERFGIKVLICVIERQTNVFIPKASDRLAENDKVYVTGNMRSLITFSRLAGHSEHKARSVMILGGGRISYYLAESIANSDIKYKIIEKNRDRCEHLCESLPGALIINGDGTEQRLLDEEDVSSTDIFVALTDIDEENLFAAMFASKRGAKKVIAKINRTEYMSMIDDKMIDSVINPKLITAYQIVQYVRAMQNTIGSKVDTLFRIAGERVEVLEFTVAANTKNQTIPLKNINFKSDLLIAAIVRAGSLIVPGGEAVFRKGDSVVVVTMDQSFADMNDIFADAT